ncbi:hypothetical protein KAW65_09405 [candidate division WOR-3 bacterium]|nr:hypothetical protein [candidate division WOR-3 bacterium]
MKYNYNKLKMERYKIKIVVRHQLFLARRTIITDGHRHKLKGKDLTNLNLRI